MIEIRMETKKCRLTVKGHATPEESKEYREICAAASALAQALMYTITKLDLQDVEYRPDRGDLMIRARPEKNAEEETRRRFEAYGDGFDLLAQSHPQSVTMIRDGRKIIPGEDET